MDQNKLNNQHPIRSHLRNQSKITKISPRGDGFLEEFGKEVEPSSCALTTKRSKKMPEEASKGKSESETMRKSVTEIVERMTNFS